MKDFNNIHINYHTSFVILHLNIASLNRYIDSLNTLLALITKPIKVICITEHKITKGYFLYKCLEVFMDDAGIFIKNDLTYKIRKDLEINEEDAYESVFIEIILQNQKNIIGGCIYRHPSSPIKYFNESFLNPTLQNI